MDGALAFDKVMVIGPCYLQSSVPPGVTRERSNLQRAAVEWLTDTWVSSLRRVGHH